jgi:nicotinate-nucleotide pyrophosphorylase (carboxylating)
MSAFHPPLRPTPPTSHPAVAARTVTPLHTHAVTSSPLAFPLSPEETTALVRAALQEDEAFNDVSTIATVASTRHVRGTIVARRDGVIAGIPLAVEAFRLLDDALTLRVDGEDGTRVRKGQSLLTITGHARGILSAERTALNFLQRLSGIATLTRCFADVIAGTNATILDTRKTTPGWRTLEKYAVRAGGGSNHRLDLRSGVLIKDNHLAAIGGDIAAAVARARQIAPPATPVQVECDTIAQVDAAVAAGADGVLLDNMSLDQMREAVARCAGRVFTEASGGVTLDTVRAIADTGVDRISVGALTHSAPALDLGLDVDGL